FSVDVDTASYAIARAYLQRQALPPEEAIRVEEFVNSFDYGYRAPDGEVFSLNAEAFPSPNRRGYHVLHLGLKGREIAPEDRLPANLVFVIDVSGSMDMENRLGLVKESLLLLVDQLREDDLVGIVVYGDSGRELLEPTGLAQRSRILRAIGRLQPGGSTNAQEGILLGYRMAARNLRKGAINRVILCSDGVANNGISTSAEGIFTTVREQAQRGITISTVGFGMGNFNDVLMERLAQLGDGNYAYVDELREARRIFVAELTGTLQVIARDVKIQVGFDPAAVARFRLLGYENRMLEAEDFADDRKDAGEVGAGHAVTALYEVKFTSAPGRTEFGTVRVRYKEQLGAPSQEIAKALPPSIVRSSLSEATPAARLSLVVASFAEKLRGSYWVRNLTWDQVLDLEAQLDSGLRDRPEVAELRSLIARAAQLDQRPDRFAELVPVAEMDFDHVPVLQ
ncbi:MAG: VWA domain-containing protein, partial [bacterium]|nr:VWA domain-containing protein [bacterium]